MQKKSAELEWWTTYVLMEAAGKTSKSTHTFPDKGLLLS